LGFSFGLSFRFCASLGLGLRFCFCTSFGFGFGLRLGFSFGLGFRFCTSFGLRLGFSFSLNFRFYPSFGFRCLSGLPFRLSFGFRAGFGLRVSFRPAWCCGGRLLAVARRLGLRLVCKRLRACVGIEQILPGVEDLLAVSATCEPAGGCEQCFLHAEYRFAVGAAGG
jgi:hypothetical protein